MDNNVDTEFCVGLLRSLLAQVPLVDKVQSDAEKLRMKAAGDWRRRMVSAVFR